MVASHCCVTAPGLSALRPFTKIVPVWVHRTTATSELNPADTVPPPYDLNVSTTSNRPTSVNQEAVEVGKTPEP